MFACYLECFALSTALRRSILVCTSKGAVWVFPHDESNGLEPICLFFNAAIQHYEFMDGPVAPELKSMLRKDSQGEALDLKTLSDWLILRLLTLSPV